MCVDVCIERFDMCRKSRPAIFSGFAPSRFHTSRAFSAFMRCDAEFVTAALCLDCDGMKAKRNQARVCVCVAGFGRGRSWSVGALVGWWWWWLGGRGVHNKRVQADPKRSV